MKLTDSSLMPYGKYKGDKMINVPAFYLLWLFENNKCGKDVADYVKENLDVLKHETKLKP